MYKIFILFYLLINVKNVKNLELKHMPPENESNSINIIEEGGISDGNGILGFFGHTTTQSLRKKLKNEKNIFPWWDSNP